jgi:hypothetical protein
MESDIVGESGGTMKRQRVSPLILDWTAANHWADIFSTERHRVGVVLRIHRMLMVGEQKEEARWQRGGVNANSGREWMCQNEDVPDTTTSSKR